MSEIQAKLKSISKQDWKDYNVNQLSEMYGVSTANLRSYANTHKITVKKIEKGERKSTKFSSLMQIPAKDWETLTAQELCETHKVNEKTLRSFASRNGIKIKRAIVPTHDFSTIPQADWDKLTIREIIEKHGFNEKDDTLLRGYAKRQNISVVKRHNADNFAQPIEVVNKEIRRVSQLLDKIPMRLQDHRLNKGLTVNEMADFLNMNRIIYGKIEKGVRTITLLDVALMAERLEISLDALMLGKVSAE